MEGEGGSLTVSLQTQGEGGCEGEGKKEGITVCMKCGI